MKVVSALPAHAEQSACGRYWYDAKVADSAVQFFARHLRLTEDRWAGQPFVLEPWQADDIIRPLFGWRRVSDGTRRYRRAVVWVPRKNGKTELAAGVALLALLGDGTSAGQVYSMAATEKQARLVFGKACAMVSASRALGKQLEVLKTAIYCPSLHASFRPLSGTPAGKHGLSASGLIGDEVHEWRDGDLYTFVHQSTAARAQPIEFLISTAGVRQGFGWELWLDCQAIRANPDVDPETLVVIYAADPDADWTDPQTWRQANPNLGVSVSQEYLVAECQRAQQSPALENAFRRYHLNQWTQQAVRWLPMRAWDASAGDVGWRDFPEYLAGRKCFAGLDLSSVTDLTAYVLIFPPDEDAGEWYAIPRFFLPGDNLEEKQRSDRAPYVRWAGEGQLRLTSGNVVDYSHVRAALIEDAQVFDLQGVAVDRWNASETMTRLGDAGLNVLQFGQGFASYTGPAKHLERLVLAGRFRHGGHELLRMHAENVAIDTDSAGNIKPTKARSTGRIDGIAAACMGIGLGMPREATQEMHLSFV